MEYRILETINGAVIEVKTNFTTGTVFKKTKTKWCRLNEEGKPITKSNLFGIKPPNHPMKPFSSLELAKTKLEEIKSLPKVHEID